MFLAMSAFEHTHQYATLPGSKWLRLLRILSFDGEEAVCSLEAFDMDRLPEYDCLSYTWGDPMSRGLYPPGALQDELSTSCDKQVRHADGSIIRVTENLVQAMKRLTELGYSSALDSPTPHYLWIDAICINQGDNCEKSSQVAMMDFIYSRAENVVVWLGEEDFHTAGALKVMEALAEVDYTRLEKAPYYDDFDAFTAYDTLVEAGEALGLPYIEAGEWRDYAAFLQRKWFERIWVLQEKVFAKKTEVLVGPHRLPWDYITEAASVLKQSGLANPLQALYLFAVDGYDYYRNGTVSKLFEDRLSNYQIFSELSKTQSIQKRLETLLYYSKRLNATQPLDHVFAILGIWDPTRGGSLGSNNIRVDYTKSVTSVYVEATILAIEESGSLGILSLLDGQPSNTSLPSWVPDYSQKTTILPLIPWPHGPNNRRSKRWNASRGLSFRRQREMDDRSSHKLSVQGLHLDVIEDVGPTYHEIDRDYQWAELLQVLLNGEARDQHPGQPSDFESFWRTLIKDTFRNQSAGKDAEEAFAALVTDRIQGLCAKVQGLKESVQILHANKGDLIQLEQELNELDKLQPRLERTRKMIQQLYERVPRTHAWSQACKDFEQRPGDTSSSRVEDTNENKHSDDGLEDANTSASILRDVESSFWAAYSGRRLFRTKTGWFGISNQNLQNGDSVWILAGAETPFLLRRRSENDWLMIGDAYIHGAMEGEATEKLPDTLRSIDLV